MKGKKSFNKSEVEQIQKLIAENLRTTPDKQKGIRAKIRKIGFYFSDFSSKNNGYTVADFEALIHSGAIKVVGDKVQTKFSAITQKIFRQPTPKKTNNNNYISSQYSKNSLEPIVDNNTEILILGTMPGDRSLSVGEYYAHSGNRFWKIIAKITNEKIPTSYDEKKNMLIKHKIGLWDVAKTANRKGSMDSNISDEIPNDLDKFLNNYPKIKIVGLNGSKAANLFDNFFNKRPYIVYHNLASTSGANTSITFEKSCTDWKRILNK
ncbi:MAG: DNA-deoxyinosine glycosylase [Ginsengibacter sp.]